MDLLQRAVINRSRLKEKVVERARVLLSRFGIFCLLVEALIESDVTRGAGLVVLLHQQADPEQREAEEEHQCKDDPAATADVAGCVRWAVRSAVRAAILSVRCAHLARQSIWFWFSEQRF